MAPNENVWLIGNQDGLTGLIGIVKENLNVGFQMEMLDWLATKMFARINCYSLRNTGVMASKWECWID